MKENTIDRLTRRNFLSTGTLALAGLTAFPLGALSSEYGSRNLTAKPLRLGIIGMGNRGSGLASVIKSLPNIEVSACCDNLEQNLKIGLDRSGSKAKGYRNYRKLLEDKNVDAVIIAVPLYLHYIVAKEALEAQKHVYLEKTMTHTIDEAIKLEQIVRTHPHLTFQIGHQYRYFMLYHKVREMIKLGYFGDVLQYECQYHRNSNWRRPVPDPSLERHVNWRMYNEYSGGLMAELCSHQIDIVNWLSDSRPVCVTAMGGVDYWKDGRETYDNIRALFAYPNGVKANVSSILSNAYNGYSIRVLGTKATADIQMESGKIYYEQAAQQHGTVDGVTKATVLASGPDHAIPIDFVHQDEFKRNPTAYSLLDFAECVRTGKRPFADVETGKINTIAVCQANQSAKTGKVINCVY